jgi:hypothetical protein
MKDDRPFTWFILEVTTTSWKGTMQNKIRQKKMIQNIKIPSRVGIIVVEQVRIHMFDYCNLAGEICFC